MALEGLDVLDPETMERVPADGETIGEVMFRGNIVMKGYLNQPDRTAEVIRDGWYVTGDIGMVDEDGLIFINDRL